MKKIHKGMVYGGIIVLIVELFAWAFYGLLVGNP